MCVFWGAEMSVIWSTNLLLFVVLPYTHSHTIFNISEENREVFFHDQATYVTLKTRKLHRQWTLITIFHSLFSLLSPTTFNIRSLSSRCSRHTKDLWWWFSSLTFFVCLSSVLNCVMNCSTRWLQMLTTSSHH